MKIPRLWEVWFPAWRISGERAKGTFIDVLSDKFKKVLAELWKDLVGGSAAFSYYLRAAGETTEE
jgi:hypothetical protein